MMGRRKYTINDRSSIEMRFIQIPVLTMSGMRRYPEPKTTALGGVATGSMKAQDAATVAATINIKGCTSMVKAMGARIGSIMDVVAIFEVISVRKLTAATKVNTRRIMATPSSKVI